MGLNLRFNRIDAGCFAPVIGTSFGSVDACGRGWKALDFLARAARATHQFTGAVWAFAVQRGLRTMRAERALKRANQRVVGIEWQVAIAAFTVRT
ncbi:hypothetical protein AX279_11815 [Pseudomonas sp. J237]|nr:hypothetical protein AX279_11815 [Pseudomonas sp. J237]